MRPLTLTLAGFRSHDDETTISFEDRTFIAIVGPTGAGKSSLLDAISFALYGKTPRVKSGTKRLICSRRDAARVRLRFAVEKDEYEVTRVLRRSGSGEHVLEDLSSGERITGDGVVTEKVGELLGLDFDAFCSSVLLAQGRFSRFLEATPAEQMKILKGVFRVDQIDHLRDAAKGRVRDLDLEVAEIDGALGAIPADRLELLESARRERGALGIRIEELGRAVPAERKLLEEESKAAEQLERAEADLESLRSVAAGLLDAGEFEKLAEQEERVLAAAKAAAEALATAAEAASASDAAFTDLEEELGTLEKLAGVRASCAALGASEKQIATLTTDRERAEKEEVARRAAATQARTTYETARAELTRVRDALHALQQEHRAHVLRADLAPGQPCPVCEQPVDEVPSTTAPAALDDAENSVRRTEKAEQEAADLVRRAESDLVRAENDAEHVVKRLAEEQARAEERRAEITGALGSAEDPGAEVETRCRRLEKAKAAAADARRKADGAREDVERAREDERRFATARGRVAADLVHVAGRLGESPPAIDASAAELGAGAAALRDVVEARAAAAEAGADAARAALTGTETKLQTLRSEAGLQEGETIADAHADAKAAAAGIDERISQLEEFVAAAERLAEKKRVVSRERTLYARLADDFTDRHFIKFLLEDRRRLLSELGSAQLRALTARYRFDDNLEFNVVDELDADKLRDVETLSGGELFLASLALALGLADAVARHGGRLQCFFLDEGFGSLDAESLDLALDGIEQIVHPDRLIGVVSHVPALAQRIEDKIRLERSPEGTTILRTEADF